MLVTDPRRAILQSRVLASLGPTKRGYRLVSAAITTLASVAIILLGFRAYSSFDIVWDSLAYHLPFAARHVGLCGADCLTLSSGLEARFLGFPPLAELTQGILWRLTGWPEATNFASLGAFLLLAAYLRRFWLIPWGLAILALLGIPVVQIMATTSYIDLITNTAAAIAVLSVLMIVLHPERVDYKGQSVAVVSLIFLGNAKTQMVPVAGLLGVLFLVFENICVRPEQRGPWRIDRSHRGGVITGGLLLILISASALKDLVLFGNPFYPVRLSILGIHLPGTEGYPFSNTIPDYLRQVPNPVRWLLSVVEFQSYDYRPTPWILGQGGVEQSMRSFGMGGYFVANVLVTMVLFVFGVKRLPAALKNRIYVAMTLLTVVVAFLPDSHELRYYMFWMIVLVALNLYISFSPICPDFRDRELLARMGLGWVVVCFLSVLSLSGARYFMPGVYFMRGGGTAEQIVINAGIRNIVNTKINDGDVVCVQDKGPLATLYARVFHPGRHYSVIVDGDPSKCNKVI
jgi:hypothetical protein